MSFRAKDMFGNWSFPTDIKFGCGEINKLVDSCKELNLKKPLLVTDKNISETEIRFKICDLLKKSKIKFDIFHNISGNPTDLELDNAIQVFKSNQHDSVITFGGGSALDVGKMVAFMARQILSIWEFEDIGNNWKKANSNSIYPIIAIPTTAGTGSEVGRASVITNLSKQEKKIIFHPKVLPSKVICDPELTVSMPANITAGTGLDAFAHSVEAFCSPHYHPMAQGIALEGMRLVVNNLLKAYENPYDLTSRSNMMCAALMGATAFQKGLGAIHAMSHSIGALANSHHGTTNAVCMLPVLRLNSNIVSELFDNASAYLGIKGGFKGFYKFVEKLNLDLNIPKNLIKLDVKRDTIDLLVSKSLRDPSCNGNPVKLTHQNMYKLFEETFDS